MIQIFSKRGFRRGAITPVPNPSSQPIAESSFSKDIDAYCYYCEIPSQEHKQSAVSSVSVYKPNGQPVSVVWWEAEGDKICIDSNISLQNHKILIN